MKLSKKIERFIDRNKKAVVSVAVIGVPLFLGYIYGNPDVPERVSVHNAPDGSVWEVQKWFNANLIHPESLKIIKWYPVHKIGDSYVVQVSYQARNKRGEIVYETQLFQLDQFGQVYSHMKTE